MTIDHSLLSNDPTNAQHGIVHQTVANAPALAALNITADDLAQKRVFRQLDSDQLWVPNTTGIGATFTELGTARAAFAISAFAAGTATVELGSSVANPSFTATENRTPTSLVLTNDANGESKNVVGTPTAFSSSQTYSKTVNNTAVTFTLTGSDGVSSASRTAAITWRPRVYHGPAVAGVNTEAGIKALASSALQATKATSYTDVMGASEYDYWAAPASYGTPTFTVGGFAGGFSLISNTISLTLNGVAQNYQLWRSDVAGLGSTPVVVS